MKIQFEEPEGFKILRYIIILLTLTVIKFIDFDGIVASWFGFVTITFFILLLFYLEIYSLYLLFGKKYLVKISSNEICFYSKLIKVKSIPFSGIDFISFDYSRNGNFLLLIFNLKDSSFIKIRLIDYWVASFFSKAPIELILFKLKDLGILKFDSDKLKVDVKSYEQALKMLNLKSPFYP